MEVLNEKELIEKGKMMMQEGLGATFVFKWMRERVADPETRARILEAVHGRTADKQGTTIKSGDQKKRARLLRTASHLIDDFRDSINKLGTIGKGYFLLGGLYLLSVLIFQAQSLPHSAISLLLGLLLLFTLPRMTWTNQVGIIAAIGVLTFLLVLEFGAFGLPDKLVPGLGETRRYKLINAFTLLNDFSPWVYFGVKLVLLFPLFRLLGHHYKANKIPLDVKKELDFKLH